MTDPSSHVTTYTYNPENQQISQVTSSGGTAVVSTDYFDAGGNEVAVTSPGGNPYSRTNTSGCDPITTSTCTYTTYNTYNSSGKLLTSTNPDGGVTTNYYSATSGNLIATTGPSGNPGTCNPTTSSTPCADTTTFSYNSLNQVTCAGEPNTADNTCSSIGTGAGLVQYTYFADGQVHTMSDASGTTTDTYDSSDRLATVTNGAGAEVTYGYGQSSEPTCVSYPNASSNTCTSPGSGLGIVNYTYNSLNEPATMTDWAGNTFTYGYNATGQHDSLSINSGAVGVTTTYDDAGNVASVDATAASGATPLLDLSVTRAENGQITAEVPVVGTTTMATDSFGYNTNNQVNSGPIIGTTGSTAYSYKPDGGITQATNTFASAGYDTADRLCWTYSGTSSNACGTTPTGGTTYSNNTDGERTSMVPSTGNSESYAWDSPTGDLLCANTSGATCSTSSPTSSTTVYSYNGSGLRATSKIGSTTTNYTWGDIGSSPQDLSDGTWDYVYVPGSDVPVEQVGASGSSPAADLLLSDPNGSVRGIVQLSSGTHQDQLVNYTDYDAYGNPITKSGGSTEAGGLTAAQTSINANYVATTAFGFGGGYTDATGLIYLVHRYYDPVTGQFLSVDPDVAETNQPYEYAGDNPVNITDEMGTCDTVLACAPDPAPAGMTQCAASPVDIWYCVPCGPSLWCSISGTTTEMCSTGVGYTSYPCSVAIPPASDSAAPSPPEPSSGSSGPGSQDGSGGDNLINASDSSGGTDIETRCIGIFGYTACAYLTLVPYKVWTEVEASGSVTGPSFILDGDVCIAGVIEWIQNPVGTYIPYRQNPKLACGIYSATLSTQLDLCDNGLNYHSQIEYQFFDGEGWIDGPLNSGDLVENGNTRCVNAAVNQQP